jgi:hypothetical protein
MKTPSYIDRWAAWYSKDSSLAEYGDPATYKIGADFLKGLAVEDWGCGRGWFKTLHDGPYLGIDGTASEHADIVADLREYRSETPGLWLRHVLEHNRDWKLVLGNAVASAQERIAIVVFTPDGEGEQIGYTEELDVPDIAVPHQVIADAVKAAGFQLEQYTIPTGSYYKEETLFLGQKPQQ